MTDPVVEAMEAGAGLPVLGPLDRLLEQRSLSDEQPDAEADIAVELMAAVDTWLDNLESRVTDRLANSDDGPLKAAIADRLIDQLNPPRDRVAQLQRRIETETVPWEAVIELLDDLQDLREETQDLQRAAGHLAELARLVEDIPDDEDGHAALDELAALEAQAAAQPNPPTWARTAKELEKRALAAVRLKRTAPPAASTEDPPSPPEPSEAMTPARPQPELSLVAGDGAVVPTSPDETAAASNGSHGANGHSSNGHAASTVHQRPRVDPASAPQRPNTSSRTGHDEPAGRAVLAEWDRVPMSGSFRHGPLWAPIKEGDVVPAEGATEELLERAADVEVDLVDLELPRVLAVPTGGGAQAVRERIADRAEAITCRRPQQPAREAFLDYLVGKLPRRYRETSWGLALVESIAYALCTDDPWSEEGPDYQATVRRMVAAELERTPAVDLDELAGSLVGAGPKAEDIVQEAAEALAGEDPRITFHEEGILVRALAAREDPDALYDLKESLKRRLDDERAEELVAALITTGEESR